MTDKVSERTLSDLVRGERRAPPVPEGAARALQLREAGFSEREIGDWATGEKARLSAAGFSDAEVNTWLGSPPPDQERVKGAMVKNFEAAKVQATEVTTFTEALEAGWGMSVTSLLAKPPEKIVTENTPFAARIAAGAATLVGDFPWMVGGALLGGGAGAPTGPGALVTAGAGAFALPAGMRATLMDAYEKGEFTTFGDFWERTAGIMWQTAKGWVTGAATAGAGHLTRVALPPTAPAWVKAAAPTTAEIATMTTVGKALEGHAPKAEDFVEAAILVFGMKGAIGGAAKLREVYAKTGARPAQVLEAAKTDPTIVQDLASSNKAIPEALKPPLKIQIENTPEARAHVEQYVARIKAGEDLGPIVVDRADPARIVDGNHRAAAYALAGKRASDIVEVDPQQWLRAGAEVAASDKPVTGPEGSRAILERVRQGGLEQAPAPAPKPTKEQAAARELEPWEIEKAVNVPGEKLGLEHQAVRTMLQGMADAEAGWAQIGGRLDLGRLVEANRQDNAGMAGAKAPDLMKMGKPAFTTWIPKAEWWRERPDRLNETQVKRAVAKALAGEKMSPAERRTVEYMTEVAAERIRDMRSMGSDAWAEAAREGALEGLEPTRMNVKDVDAVARAASKDPAALERAAISYENDSAGFMTAVREILGEQKTGKAAAAGGLEPQGEPRAPSAAPAPARPAAGPERGQGPEAAVAGAGGAGKPPGEPPRPPGTPEPSDAQRAVLARISMEPAPKRAYTWGQFYTHVKDDLWPIREAVKEMAGAAELITAKDPYKLARLTRGAFGKAEQFLEFSPFNFKTYENVGKSLRKILEPVEKDMDGLRAYAVAKRSIELSGRQIKTGVPLEQAKAVVKEGAAKYEQVFQDLRGYQDHLVDYLKDAGVISEKSVAAIREANKDYVPVFRLMDEEGAPGGAGAGLKVHQPIKAIKGSERLIIDPLESIVKNTYLYITLAERNAVGRVLLERALETGREDLMTRVQPKAKPVTVLEKEVAKFLEEHGLDKEQAEAFTIFRRGALTPAEDQIVVYTEGKAELYQVPRELAAAFKATDRESVSMLVRVMAVPARVLRAGATLAPEFIGRNPIRDQLSALVLSKNGYVPVLDMVRGALSIAKKDADFQAWLKSGGANAALVSLDRDYVQMSLARHEGGMGYANQAWNLVKSPIEALRVVSELMENATRLGEFKKALKGDYSKEAIQAAGFEAREVTLDFGRLGAKTRAMNMITAFWNANLEGQDRVVRAFATRPLATTTKIAAGITLPSVILWAYNHDDPRWKEIPNWQRDLFWIVMTEDTIYRIPKPFELGVLFGSAPERLLDAYFDAKPNAFKDWFASFSNTIGVNMIPTMASPVLGQITNFNLFTDRPIVPHAQEKLLPEYQYSPYTTEATKALGHLLASIPSAGQFRPRESSFASPQVIDNYIRSWTGGLGVYAWQIADAALRKTGALPDPVRPAKTLADMPFVKGFVIRHPTMGAQPIQDFYDRYERTQKVTATIRHLAMQGNAEAALREATLDPSLLYRLESVHQALGNASKVLRLIDQNQQFTPEEKRQLMDNIYTQMSTMARAGNETALTIERAVGKKPTAKPVPAEATQ